MTPRHGKIKELFKSLKIKEPPKSYVTPQEKYISSVQYIDALGEEIKEKRKEIKLLKRTLNESKNNEKELKEKITQITGGGFSGYKYSNV